MKKTVRTRVLSFLLVFAMLCPFMPGVLAAEVFDTPAEAQVKTAQYYMNVLNYQIPSSAAALALYSTGANLSGPGWKLARTDRYDSSISVQQNAIALLGELSMGSAPAELISGLASRQNGQGFFGSTTADHIWAMLALTAAKQSYSREAAYDTLLSRQLTDGSFSATGSTGDVITTAYGVVLLSFQNTPKAASAMQHALSYIMVSSVSGFGSSDAAAAALSAYVAAGRGLSDSFTKTAYEELLTYRLANGSYCYLKGGATSAGSTAVALLAISELNKGSSVFSRIAVAVDKSSVDIDIISPAFTDPAPLVNRKMGLSSFDLSAYGSAAYNQDSPSALHAIITALDRGSYSPKDSSKFDFANGQIGKINLSFGIPSGAQWYYTVNNYPVRKTNGDLLRPGEYTIKASDHLTVFTPSSFSSNFYTFFDQKTASVKTGENLNLTLSGYRLSTAFGNIANSPSVSPISGATLLVNGLPYSNSLGGSYVVTDAQGKVSIAFSQPGTYVLSAESKDSLGKVNVHPICSVTVSGDVISEQNRTVKLRVEGSTRTYVSETSFTFTSQGSPNLFDALSSALSKSGIAYYAPTGSGNITRIGTDADTDTAKWQFSVNGAVVSGDMRSSLLSEGDSIVVAYGKNGLKFPSFSLPESYIGGDSYPIRFTYTDVLSSSPKPLSGVFVQTTGGTYQTDAEGKIVIPSSALLSGANSLTIEDNRTADNIPTVVRLKSSFTPIIQRTVTLNSANPSVNITSENLYITVNEGFSGAYLKVFPSGTQTLQVKLPKLSVVRGTSLLQIEEGTTISAPGSFDGKISVYQDLSLNLEGKQILSAMQFGSPSVVLASDKPIRLVLPGTADKKVGLYSGGGLTEVTNVLSSDSSSALGALPQGIYRKGKDVILYTKSLTSVVVYQEKEPVTEAGTITLRIAGGEVKLPTTTLQIKSDTTVLSLLEQTKFAYTTIEETGKKNVLSIGTLKNGDKGEKSYWVYKVNGAHFVVSAEEYKLKNGDRVEWLYTEDGGVDIGAEPENALNPDGSIPSVFKPEDAKESLEAALNYLADHHEGKPEALYLLWKNDRLTSSVLSTAAKSLVKSANGSFYSSEDLANILLLVGASGEDIRKFEGYDLLAALFHHENMMKEGSKAEAKALSVYYALSVTPPPNAKNSINKLISDLLSVQNSDGGFPAARGGVSSADITAEVLLGLAPYSAKAGVSSALERAISYLGRVQADDGSYLISGTRNSPTISRAITALAAANLAPDNEQFIKQRGGLLGALKTFETAMGCYANVSGEKTDVTATLRAAEALTAALLQHNGQGELYYHAGRTAEKFRDSGDASYAIPAIDYMSLNGMMTGIGDGLFSPNGKLTREQMVKLMVSALGVYAPNATHPFADIKRGVWYDSYIGSAYQLGLVSGIDDTTFGVGMPITRQDLATMIYRAAGKLGIPLSSGSEVTLTDMDQVAPYAKEAVRALYTSKILSGRDDGSFDPKATCTRAEAAIIFYRIFHID